MAADNGIDLQSALGMFVQGTQQLAVSQALTSANDQVQQIKMSGIKASDQRVQLGQIAQNLVGHMVASGASGSQIDQARQAYQPKQYASSDAAILDATMTGNGDLLDKAVQADKLSASGELEKYRGKAGVDAAHQQRLFSQQDELNDKKFDQQKQLLELKGSMQNKQLSQEEVSKVQGFDSAAITLTDMMHQVDNDKSLVGPVNGRIPGRTLVNEKFAAFKAQSEQFFNQYRKEITGAGAQMKELEMLRQATPNVTDPPNIFKAKIKKILSISDKIKGRYLQNLSATGRNTKGLEGNPAAASLTDAPAATPAGVGVMQYFTPGE